MLKPLGPGAVALLHSLVSLVASVPSARADDYSGTVLDDAPTSYWRLGDLGLPYADSAGNVPFTSGAGTWTAGAFADGGNGAIHFLSSSLCSSSSLTVPASYTVEFWFRGDQTAYGLNMDPSTRLFQTRAGGPSGAFGIITDPSTNSWDWGTTDVLDGAWHHLAATVSYDGASGETAIGLYVDGVVDAVHQRSGPPATGTATNLCLGSTWGLNTTGDFDDVAFYPTALSPDRIAAHFSPPKRDSQLGSCRSTPHRRACPGRASWARPSTASTGHGRARRPTRANGGAAPRMGASVSPSPTRRVRTTSR